MITINSTGAKVRSLDAHTVSKHSDHYFGDNGVTVKINRWAESFKVDLHVSTPDNRDFSSVYGIPLYEALIDADNFLNARPVAVGDQIDIHVNQGWREGEIEAIKRTRIRIAYDMPNAGTVGGWYPIVFRSGGAVYTRGDLIR